MNTDVKICIICKKEIIGNYITHTLPKNILCGNECLIEYRLKNGMI